MYFEEPGKINTEETLKLAFERGMALGINEVVVASTSGETALKAADIFEDFKLRPSVTIADFASPLNR